MFSTEIYRERRRRLRQAMGSGLLLFPGNGESPMNFPSNTYPFRQDSSFLYYFGLDAPGLAALIDLDQDEEIIFGSDPSEDEIVWTGPQPALREKCERVGVPAAAPPEALTERLRRAVAQGRPAHFLPPYRAEVAARLEGWLGLPAGEVAARASVALIKAVAAQRSRKAPEEIEQIELALAVTHRMHELAMRLTRPGVTECAVAGAIEGLALQHGMRQAFPIILTVRGETLHNHVSARAMEAGELAVNDSGAESPLRYAGDITRTLPVGGRFDPRQREVYTAVLDAQRCAIEALAPGIEFREVHRIAARALVSGLKEMGLMQGDPDEAVAAGAHTLFFPCGLGHMLGLDVHDMEGLGEDYVGYTDSIRRNPAFGWKWLRLARPVEPGFVVTVEPGIYFIPVLIERWQAERKCATFINYARLEDWMDFGGIRIEDDLLVTETGSRVLGVPIPKTIEEIEAAMAG